MLGWTIGLPALEDMVGCFLVFSRNRYYGHSAHALTHLITNNNIGPQQRLIWLIKKLRLKHKVYLTNILHVNQFLEQTQYASKQNWEGKIHFPSDYKILL